MIVECPGCRVRYDLSGRRVGSRVRCRCGTGFVVPRPKLEAGVLQCAACGAPCAPDDSACAYCHAVLAAVACPKCFGCVFPGADHCAHCGAELLVGARSDPALMPVRACPRCEVRAELAPRLVADTLLDECHRCGGVWVENKVFESLVKNRDQQARLEAAAVPEITLDDRRALSSKVAMASRSAREYIPCPDCRQLMNRKNFATISGVLVDLCKPHGIWFDAGELGRIVRFVMRGGLIEARHRQLEELERGAKEKRVNEFVLSGMSDPIEPELRSGWVEQLLQVLLRFLQ
jgi:Zn-finger nucleic acid-binding protein